MVGAGVWMPGSEGEGSWGRGSGALGADGQEPRPGHTEPRLLVVLWPLGTGVHGEPGPSPCGVAVRLPSAGRTHQCRQRVPSVGGGSEAVFQRFTCGNFKAGMARTASFLKQVHRLEQRLKLNLASVPQLWIKSRRQCFG